MKVLITGANGFIGRALVAALCEEKRFEAFALGGKNSANQNREFLKPENYFQADISGNLTALAQKIKQRGGAETVVHCAGLAHQFGRTDREDFWRVNVAGTENVVRLAAEIGTKHFILISSVAVYGGIEQGAKREVSELEECRPQGFYAESKLAGEAAAAKICRERSIRLTVLRPATVIGAGDRGNVRRLIETIDKRRFVWIGRGENRKSLIDKADVAGACLQILKKQEEFEAAGEIGEPEIYNVAAEPLKMREIVREIARALGRSGPKVKIPDALLGSLFFFGEKLGAAEKTSKLKETIEKWLAEDVYAADKLKLVYDFAPKIPVSEAIGREVAWYLRQKRK